MLQPYLPFLILFAVAAGTAVMMIVLSHFAAPRRPTRAKAAPYESGMPPLGSARERFSIKFYLVAMLFILFDIETVFLIPWGTIFFTGGGTNGPGMGFLLVEMLVFLVILFVGYVYVWKRGALRWD